MLSFEEYAYYKPATPEAKATLAEFLLGRDEAVKARREVEERLGVTAFSDEHAVQGQGIVAVRLKGTDLPPGFKLDRRFPLVGRWARPDKSTEVGREVLSAWEKLAQFSPTALARRFALDTDQHVFTGEAGPRGGHLLAPNGVGAVAVEGDRAILSVHPLVHDQIPGCRRIRASAALAAVERVRAGDSVTGFDRAPKRYSTKGRETIDRIRDLAFAAVLDLPHDSRGAALADLLFAYHCEATSLKYEDRAGEKDDPEDDLDKARWYREMAAHARTGAPDPRHARADFKPYRRHP